MEAMQAPVITQMDIGFSQFMMLTEIQSLTQALEVNRQLVLMMHQVQLEEIKYYF